MQKLWSLFFVSSIIAPMSISIVACSTKSLYGVNLAAIPDYTWSKEEPYFQGYAQSTPVEVPTSFKKAELSEKLQATSYFDLSTHSTAFKIADDLKKQVPTAVPLNSHFLPNGNYVSDFKQVPKVDFYDETNKLVDWTAQADFDAPYNTAKIPLQKAEKTMTQWVDTQDSRVKELNMATIIDTTSMSSSIVGAKRTYERSFNNYQYNDILVSWAGSASEGIVIPPAKNQIEKAHLNGTKIIGNIFLDGYHGLTSEILAGFLAKNADGTYKVVDVLINMAVTLGFDGWFWNNEPNGEQPNGFVVDNAVMYEIMGQMQDKINGSTDPMIKQLIVVGYKNQGVLRSDDGANATQHDSEEIFENTNMYVNDFYVFANEVESYVQAKQLSDEQRFNIYTMYNAGGWVKGKIWLDKNHIGRKDLRDLNYFPFKNAYNQGEEDQTYTTNNGGIDDEALINDYFLKNDKQWNFRTSEQNKQLGGARNSISLFASHVGYDLASQDIANRADNPPVSAALDTYQMVNANNYDDMLYTGANKFLTNDDQGVVLFPGSERDDSIFADKSYGVGNLVQEKTVLINDNQAFKTNFSTGQGNQFVTLDENNQRVLIEDYAWSNTNIADVQPTYKWDVTKNSNGEYVPAKVSGYYDYYHPYLKGNSISLGAGFDQNNGSINPISWQPNTTYRWNIMGANYTNNDQKTISMTLRVPTTLENDNIKLSIEGDEGQMLVPEITNYQNRSPAGDGYEWLTISTTIAAPIAKLGIEFTTPDTNLDFLISCGEIKVANGQSNSTVPLAMSFDNVDIESIVNRNHLNYVRFSVNENVTTQHDIYNYYEVYYKNENNQLVRISESNTPYFFLNRIPEKYTDFYVKKIDGNQNVNWLEFTITN